MLSSIGVMVGTGVRLGKAVAVTANGVFGVGVSVSTTVPVMVSVGVRLEGTVSVRIVPVVASVAVEVGVSVKVAVEVGVSVKVGVVVAVSVEVAVSVGMNGVKVGSGVGVTSWAMPELPPPENK
jgi:hypothetical protein